MATKKELHQMEFQLTKVGQEQAAFELAQRQARVFTSSSIVPATYQGDGNIGNVIIALDIAKRMDANPLMVMQNLYVVHGNPSWSSKFLIATINSCGRFSPLRYEFKGEEGKDDWGCRCYAYEKSDSEKTEPLYGDWVTIGMAKAEGWSTKSGSKWKSMPGQMLRYRAAAFWQRAYAPEISMGLMTADESEDIGYNVSNPNEGKFDRIEALRAAAMKQEREEAEIVEEKPQAVAKKNDKSNDELPFE